jgi:LPXTG-motif cell wall-anchored protein
MVFTGAEINNPWLFLVGFIGVFISAFLIIVRSQNPKTL